MSRLQWSGSISRMGVLIWFLFFIGSAWGQGACPAGSPVTGNKCYFIAANGSDSNSGTSESSPWLHAPGMPNCSGVCASTSPSPGEGFIFRGGDTWHFGNSSATPYTGGNWNLTTNQGTDSSCIYEGTQTGCIYYGVDKNWYSSASWTRPILTGDNPTSTSFVSSCAHQVPGGNAMIQQGVATIIDNFEMTGMCSSDANPTSGVGDTYIEYYGTGMSGSGMAFLTNDYIHGWTATSGAGNGNNTVPGTLIGGGNNGLQTFDHLVIDGSDSDPGAWGWGTFPSFYHVRDSMFRYVTQGVGQWCHDIHDNIFEHFYNPVVPTHGNILECNDDATGNAVNQPQNTPNVFYNNIVRHDDPSFGAAGQVHLWFCPESVPEYWFNNLMYDVGNGNSWDYAGPSTYGCTNTGGQFMFNNTLVDVIQPCHIPTVSHGGQYLTIYNEHLINTPFDSGSSTACGGLSSSTNLAMTDATAITQGYLASSGGTYNRDTCANEGTTPCAPTTGSDSTVGSGANHESYCTTLAAYTSEQAISTDAASACKYGTTDGCAYNSATHTMSCPAQTAATRPASVAWDSGAYEFTGLPAPVNLGGSVAPVP